MHITDPRMRAEGGGVGMRDKGMGLEIRRQR